MTTAGGRERCASNVYGQEKITIYIYSRASDPRGEEKIACQTWSTGTTKSAGKRRSALLSRTYGVRDAACPISTV